MAFRSSAGLINRSLVCWTNWIRSRPIIRCPTMMPFVVKGYEATWGSAEIPAGSMKITYIGVSRNNYRACVLNMGSFRRTFRTSFKNRRSLSIWCTMEASRATVFLRTVVVSSDFRDCTAS